MIHPSNPCYGRDALVHYQLSFHLQSTEGDVIAFRVRVFPFPGDAIFAEKNFGLAGPERKLKATLAVDREAGLHFFGPIIYHFDLPVAIEYR